MNFIYTTDWHLCDKRPSTRKDETFFEDQLKKIDFFINLCISNEVDFVIHGGDLCDEPNPSLRLLNVLIYKLRQLKKNKIKCFIVPGNHDLFGYNIKSLKRTAVGSLIASGIFKMLNGFMEIDGVNFVGIPALTQHSVDLYRNIPKNSFCVTHNAITPFSTPFEHVNIEAVKTSFKTFFLCGHLHSYFISRNGHNIFLNPGPLIRTSKIEKDHSPRCFLINKTSTVSVKELSIPCSLDVFVTEELESVEESYFVESLKDTQVNFNDVMEVTKAVADQVNCPVNIKEEALLRLKSAQESLNG